MKNMNFHGTLLEKYMGDYFYCPCGGNVYLQFHHELATIYGKCGKCGFESSWLYTGFGVVRDVSLIKESVIIGYRKDWCLKNGALNLF